MTTQPQWIEWTNENGKTHRVNANPNPPVIDYEKRAYHRSGWVHELRWTAGSRKPPEGMDKILGTWTEFSPSIQDFVAVFPDYRLGCGYSHCIRFPTKPIKRQAPEVKQRANERRKATLEANRIRQKLPLLADILIDEHRLDWKAEEHAAKLSIENQGKPYRISNRWNLQSGNLLPAKKQLPSKQE